MVTNGHEYEGTIRPPTREDLIRVCRDLNECGAKYIVLGGMALIEMELGRGTMDIDFLVDANPVNISRIREALLSLPDGASKDVKDIPFENTMALYAAPG